MRGVEMVEREEEYDGRRQGRVKREAYEGRGRVMSSTFAPPPAVLEEDIIKDTKSLNELFCRG